MASKNLKNKVSEMLLTGPGLKVTAVAVDNQIAAFESQTVKDRDALTKLYVLRADVEKLREQEGAE